MGRIKRKTTDIRIRFLIGGAIFLFLVLICIVLTQGKKMEVVIQEEPEQEASLSDALLLNKNLKSILNVHKVIPQKPKNDTLTASEIWLVPNGMSIPNYMLRASKEIQRCRGKIHWMKEIKNNRALLKYEGEQGMYPLTEIRIIDTLWLPGSSKLAVVLAAREKNTLLKNKPELLENLNFTYNLLIPSSRPELLEIGKKTNANLIPWIPMESGKNIYSQEKISQIKIGTNEKDLALKLDEALKKFNNAKGFAAFNGEDFLTHAASLNVLEMCLWKKNYGFGI